MMDFINVGFGNLLVAQRIVSVVLPDSAPVKRMIGEARAAGRVIDASGGKATRSVIITDSDHIVLSSLTPDDVQSRVGSAQNSDGREGSI